MTKIKNPCSIIAAVAVLLAVGTFYYFNYYQGISADKAAEISMDFVNKSIESDGVTASLVKVLDEGPVYGILLEIEGKEYHSYLTKDGKFLFPSGFNLKETGEGGQEEASGIEEESFEGDLTSFAQCLTESGFVLYGSKYCPYCQDQRELFKEAVEEVNYVECVGEDDQWTEQCQSDEIQSVPTWVMADGERAVGYQTLSKLSELSGCPLQ
jgi:glutaredoxin